MIASPTTIVSAPVTSQNGEPVIALPRRMLAPCKNHIAPKMANIIPITEKYRRFKILSTRLAGDTSHQPNNRFAGRKSHLPS